MSDTVLFTLAVTAYFTVLVLTGLLIPILRRLKFGQVILEDGPSWHAAKQGTPTMGGVSFFVGISGISFFVGLWFGNVELVFAAGSALLFGSIGFYDDYIKVVKKRNLGLKAGQKIIMQAGAGIAVGTAALQLSGIGTVLEVPFYGTVPVSGVFYVLFAALVFVSASNAVNLTDGLDGLASATTAATAVCYAYIAYAREKEGAFVFALVLLAGVLGFLWHNRYPARVFMGDSGSLFLGAALAALAVLTGTEIVFILMAGLFVLETLSVVIQVVSFKLRGKRVFLMSPIHHHFEKKGWSENKIVAVFTALSFLFGFLGIFAAGGF